MRALVGQDTRIFDLQRVQDFTKNTINSLIAQNPLLESNFIEDIVITTGTPRSIEHKLGKELTGFLVHRINADANVWDSQSTNSFPGRTLILNSSANVTVSIIVF